MSWTPERQAFYVIIGSLTMRIALSELLFILTKLNMIKIKNFLSAYWMGWLISILPGAHLSSIYRMQSLSQNTHDGFKPNWRKFHMARMLTACFTLGVKLLKKFMHKTYRLMLFKRLFSSVSSSSIMSQLL